MVPVTQSDSAIALAWLDIDARERALLAPYAMFSRQSAGRRYAEPLHPYRGPYQRDRDRILHTSAFRRLSGKMQVFTGNMGDYHRTRLTHTQEVAMIARTVARALRLNEDLVEALALVHDIGHPPFGHAGEDALSECIADEGGFSHNQFALALVEHLEGRYPLWPGLNLTYEVLSGQTARVDKRHFRAGPRTASAPRDKEIAARQRPLLEVQLVDAADSATYDAHDVDDAVKLGLLRLDDMSHLEFVRGAVEHVRQNYASLDEKQLRIAVVRELIDRQVSDLVGVSRARLERLAPADAQELAEQGFWIEPSAELAEQKRELEQFLYERVYRHPSLIAVRSEAQQQLRELFDKLVVEPQHLSAKYARRAEQVGLRRAVVEYLAGMTDHYCRQIHQQLVAGAPGP